MARPKKTPDEFEQTMQEAKQPIKPESIKTNTEPQPRKAAQPTLTPLSTGGVWIYNTNTGLRQYMSQSAYRRISHLSYIKKL